MGTVRERNKFTEMDGLFFESDTHEWFHDKIATSYAQTDTGLNADALKNIFVFVVRDKSTGEYDRVVMDGNTNEIIYNNGNIEAIGAFVDRLKISKRFNQ